MGDVLDQGRMSVIKRVGYSSGANGPENEPISEPVLIEALISYLDFKLYIVVNLFTSLNKFDHYHEGRSL